MKRGTAEFPMHPYAPWIREAAKELCRDGKIYVHGGLNRIGWIASEKGWIDADELAEIIAAHVPPAEGRISEEGWLIEKRGLCIGLEYNKPAWVTFTSPSAIRFARKTDAENMLCGLRSMSDKGAFAEAIVTSHSWSGPASATPESQGKEKA